MESYFRNSNTLRLINRWKYHLAVIVLAGIILSVIGSSSWVITPKFKSTAIVYPVNLSVFSEESQTEQMLQILRSNEIKDSLIEAFGLSAHYKISEKDPQYKTYIYAKMDDNISFSKTEYESVEIAVLDKDPKIAAGIVGGIINFYNKKVASMHRSKYYEVIVISKNGMAIRKLEMDSLQQIRDSLRITYGLLDYKIQTLGVSEGMSKGTGSAELSTIYKNLKEYGGKLMDIDSLFKYAQRDFLWQKNSYETGLREYSKEITYCHVVSSPYPADKKSYPVRWLIVTLAGIGSFFMGLIIVAFIESTKNRKNTQPS